ncbi:MAG: phosphocholine cytidylyltransferase family protein [Pseudanabaena sp. RU_4_16]|nr:phosphocholine cytidylyltransferase family protein [Pseudanabaena sp. RU_4_16]NKB18373.1 phosphocholine cytidylyltransferase family protein [Pseudanabaena sp. CRU_2_10]
MQAIILAAGCGSRLANVLKGQPKCLAPVADDMRLIEYQINILNSLGITDICLVLGYRAHEVYRAMGDRTHCIINRRYAETNSLYSLWLTRNWVKEDCLIMNSDILAHPRIYKRLLKSPDNALTYDSWSGKEAEHMKVSFRDARLEQISKVLPTEDSQGESLGLLKFSQQGMQALFAEAEVALSEGGENQWAPAAIARLAQHQAIVGIDVAGLPWVEIDFPEDLHQARHIVWPLIAPAALPQTAQLQRKVS